MCSGDSVYRYECPRKNRARQIRDIFCPLSHLSQLGRLELWELCEGWADKGPKVDRTRGDTKTYGRQEGRDRILEPDYILVSVVPGVFSCSFHPMTKLHPLPSRGYSFPWRTRDLDIGARDIGNFNLSKTSAVASPVSACLLPPPETQGGNHSPRRCRVSPVDVIPVSFLPARRVIPKAN